MTTPMETHSHSFSHELWTESMQWVDAHRKLIRQIAAPYFKFMVGDYEDLYQEAAIAVYNALLTARKKNRPDQLVPFFRVIFKTSCIKMATGIQTVRCLDDHFLPRPEVPETATGAKEEPDSEDIAQALQIVTKRQHEVCSWLLQQPTPVSMPDIARQFHISKRHACRLVSDSIARIQQGTS